MIDGWKYIDYLLRPILAPFWLFCILAFVLCLFTAGEALAQEDVEEEYSALWEQGDYHKALNRLEEEMDQRPELARAWSYRYMRWLSHRSALRQAVGRTDEAIADLEWITERLEEPAFFLRLALLYREKGRRSDMNAVLDRAVRELRPRWGFHAQSENLLALAQIAELRGENPKQILSSIYSALMSNYPTFSAGFVGAGALALSKRSYDLAEKHFTKGIEVNDKNQDAYAGLAECYYRAGDPRAGEVLEKLLKINPHSFPAKALEAEMLLDQGEAEKALEIIDEMLEVNPNQQRFLALKAAAFFLQDNLKAMKETQMQATLINPLCSEAYRIPGRVASRHYRFAEGVEQQRKALEVNSDDQEARAQLAQDLLRLGREEEGRKLLDDAFKADPYNVQVFNLLNLMDSLNAFESIAQGPFVLQLPKAEKDVLASDMLEQLQEAFELYQKKYAVELETPIHVQVFNDHDDFMVRSVGLPGQVGFLGICFGQLVTMDSPSARPKGEMNWRSVLWHEFVHVITLQKTKNRMPRWLSEGISVYEETERNKAWGQRMEVTYKSILDEEDLPGVEDLEAYFTQPKTPNHLMLGYFLAGEFVKFYVDSYGFSALKTALEKIGEGSDTKEALARASEKTLDDVNDDLYVFLEKRLEAYDNLPQMAAAHSDEMNMLERIFRRTEAQGDWTEKSSPFTDALKQGKQALAEQKWEEAETHLKRAHELYPDFQGPDAPLVQLIELYEKWDKPEELKGTLQMEIETDATDLSSCRRLLKLCREQEDWSGMMQAALAALAIDPFDAEVKKALLLGYEKNREWEKALATAVQLSALDPSHRTEYALKRVDLFQQLNRLDEAKRQTVQLLEEFPHYWQAQQALLELVESEK